VERILSNLYRTYFWQEKQLKEVEYIRRQVFLQQYMYYLWCTVPLVGPLKQMYYGINFKSYKEDEKSSLIQLQDWKRHKGVLDDVLRAEGRDQEWGVLL
jgi:hypothetical protein